MFSFIQNFSPVPARAPALRHHFRHYKQKLPAQWRDAQVAHQRLCVMASTNGDIVSSNTPMFGWIPMLKDTIPADSGPYGDRIDATQGSRV
jgi:hypothetical protein